MFSDNHTIAIDRPISPQILTLGPYNSDAIFSTSQNLALPRIRVDHDVSTLVNAAEEALLRLGPVLFQSNGRLVRIIRGAPRPEGIVRPLSVEAVPRSHLIELASRAAVWERRDERSEKWVLCWPDKRVLDVLAGRGVWRFPYLEAVVEIPVLRPDGTIFEDLGYDSRSCFYFDPGSLNFPKIPDSPTFEDATIAINLLKEVFEDFPFEKEHHRSAALAALLTVIGRSAIDGPTPLFAVTATVRGSGKSLLVDTISTIVAGMDAPRWSQTDNNSEERKRLLTLAIEGDRLVLIDNVESALGSPALNAALTSRQIKDRVLGLSKSASASMSAVFFATGNNLVLKGDMQRRVIPIDLDPKVEHPEERTNFRHADLLAWVMENRPRLVSAALTLLRAYGVADRPKQDLTPFGSFTAWSDLIRSTLVWVGLPDPNLGRQEIRQEGDPELDAIRSLLQAWHAYLGQTSITLRELLPLIEEQIRIGSLEDASLEAAVQAEKASELKAALGGLDPRFDGVTINQKIVGLALRHHRGRIIGGLTLERGERKKTGMLWRVIFINQGVGDVDDVGLLKPVIEMLSNLSENDSMSVDSQVQGLAMAN